jgi:flagellar biogenesis protein FliO
MAALLGLALLVMLGAFALAPAGNGSQGDPAPWAAGAASSPGILGGDSTVGAEPSLVELGTKGLIVIALLLITLQLLRRAQRGSQPAGARLVVLESRPLGSKATLHLIAVGDRRLVVGHTPTGLVALAELGAEELPDPLPVAEAGTPDDLAGVPAAPRSFADIVAGLVGLPGRKDAPR